MKNGMDFGSPWSSGGIDYWNNQPVYYGCQPYDPVEPSKDVGTIPWPVSVTTALDEYDIMRAIDTLSDDARKRLLDWLKGRVKVP